MERVGDARLVLLGEASHGTHEFYRERALITRRLIEERGFGAVAVEADWPAAYRVNRYVRGTSADASAAQALADFLRFLLLTDEPRAAATLAAPRLERAVGAVDRLLRERASHYFEARLGRQFDAVVHVDETRALEPLEPSAAWQRDEMPETYPHAV